MARNMIGWFEIYVQDMKRAKAFYESVFEVKLDLLNESGPELWAFPPAVTDKYGASGSLARMEGVASGGNSTVVYFSCADCEVEAKRVVEAGGKLLKEKFPIGRYGYVALGFDTEGNLFGLHSMQ
jgi:uncharacterized protein